MSRDLEVGVTLTQMPRCTLAVTLPCYGDTELLPKAVKLLEQVTPAIESDFLIVVAEDGSDSSGVISDLSSRYSNIVYFHSSRRLGRGATLRQAWSRVSAEIYLFMDVDLATDLFRLNAFSSLVQKAKNGCDLVTGSRYHPDSAMYRPIIRWLASLAYNRMVRLLFGSKVRDHQCGFKAFSAGLIREVRDVVKSSSWFWDTEIIVVAQKKGFRVEEIPVFWVEMKGPRTPIKRLLRDIWLHGTGILRLLWRCYFTGL